MSTFLKVIIGLLLTLPPGAYVVGTLVASQADFPDERDVVVDSATPAAPATAQPTGTPSAPDDDRTDRPDGTADDGEAGDGEDDGDDRADDHDDDHHEDDGSHDDD